MASGEGGRGLAGSSENEKLRKLLRAFFKRRLTRVVGVVVLGAVVVAVFFLLLNWYVAPTKPSDRKDLVLALAQILAGTALLSGIYFTWRTLQVNREGQITERFTRAIDQLGKIENGQKLFEIRVGGIYALERIARESEEDYEPIMEVLTAYVRQNAPLKPEKETAEEEPDKEERTPDPDIQAITTVLRRLTRVHGQGQPGSLDLHDTDLYRANLQEANLQKANLQEANLQKANLSKADLQRADLLDANLIGANLSKADLSGAFLSDANLIGANLSEADLLSEASLSGADLSEAILGGASLEGANLQEADLSGAKGLHQRQIEQAIGSTTTKLPDGLKTPETWSKSAQDQIRILQERWKRAVSR